MKKKLITLIALFIFSTILFIWFGKSKRIDEHCAFCDSAVLDSQVFYEDDLVLALLTHKPVTPGHSLIIPKRHVERFEMLSDEEITRIGAVTKKVNTAVEKVFGTSAYLLLQKNGVEVGQTVPHVHVHYIARKAHDDSVFVFLFKMFLANLKRPTESEEMKENVDKMKIAIE